MLGAYLLVAGCASGADAPGRTISAEVSGVDLALEDIAARFSEADVVAGPTLVDCTLSGGAKTSCFSITVRPNPLGYTPGPWCPRNAADGPSASGIWLDNGKVYDADGSFMSGLATLYDDENWQMVDPSTGAIRVTDTQEQCEAAARPDVGPEYRNTCVECQTDYLPADATITYILPLQPVASPRPSPTNFGGAGVAFNGVKLDGPAPLDAILGAYTVAPFDDCGGHVNPHVGYHYHAVTDCLSKTTAPEAHGTAIGFAMDGYTILAGAPAPGDLDTCRGHETPEDGYHYHAGDAGSNAIVGCLSAQTGCALDDPDGTCDASARSGPPCGGPPGGRPPQGAPRG